MKWWGNWLTVLGQGCKLKLLTTSNVDTTAPLFYINCCMAKLTVKIIKMTNKEKFMQLVSEEKTNTIKINKRRIKYMTCGGFWKAELSASTKFE